MLIYPHGLLDGERLAACSDEAQLHFPRIAALANGLGRFKLSERAILEGAYCSFHVKPNREQLMGWLGEYRDQYLLLAFEADDGSAWGQWCGIPEHALPRYKTSADHQSPAPPPEAVAAFNEAYAAAKRSRCIHSGDSLIISETFGSLPKALEASEAFPPVVVVVGVVVEEEIHALSTRSETQQQEPDVVETFLMKDGSSHQILRSDVVTWQAKFPTLNAEQEFHDMARWLIGAPRKRKTAAGLGRFIDSWLKISRDKNSISFKKSAPLVMPIKYSDPAVMNAR